MEDRRRPVAPAAVALAVALAVASGALSGAPAARAEGPPDAPAEARKPRAAPAASPEGPAPASGVDAARAAWWAWRLDDAARLARAAAAGPRADDAEVVLARVDLARARFDAVVTRLAPLVARRPDAYEARVVLGRALQALGRKGPAFEVLDAMATDYNDGRLTAPRDLMWLGVGLHLTDYPKNANRVFREALDADPTLDEARVHWAELFVDKYNFRDSDDLYLEVLARRPDDPRATLGRATLDVLSDREFAAAREKVEGVLAAAPDAVPAWNLLARIELENERPAAAAKLLEAESLARAPDDPEALALLGAATFLADDEAAFARVEKRALARNPRFAGFYTTVSEHAARMHRYREAATLDEKALALDPEHWRAYVGLGIGMSRLGDDEKAREYLERAYEGDPFDVRTFNLLDHFYDRTVKQYVWVDAPPMRVRVHRDERAILARYVPGLLREAWDHLVRKYGVEPELPVHVEIFPDPQVFAVRSIGLPRLDAHGICFGHVVTARSPSAGDFNWAEVLWHELSHVFHIQLSKSRVPRWFTEGLAVYEATEGRPEWRREMDEALLAYREAGRLRGVADFNLSFTQARSMQDILVAYYHAYRMAEYLATEHGNTKLKKMLQLWGRKKPTDAVFREALGVRDLAEFDRRFLAWLDGRLAHLAGSFRLGVEAAAPEAEARSGRADAAPEDAAAQAGAAVAWLGRGEADKALTYAERALALDEAEPRARAVRGLVRQARRDAAGAREDLARVVADGHDGLELRKALATLALAEGRREEAVTHLERAVAIDPQAGVLYHALVQTLDALGRKDDAYRWRKAAVAVDQGSVELVAGLLDAAREQGASAEEVQRWGELGNHVAPFSAEHHVRFARELARLGLAERARFEAASALLIAPDDAEARALAGDEAPAP